MIKASLIADMEYRSNLTIKIFTDILWYLGRISIFEVIYYHTPSIAGWQIQHMRVFLGIVFMVDALSEILFSENLEMFANKVVRGDLDLLLAKPVNSQFMVSVQKVNTSNFFSLLIGFAWFLYNFIYLPTEINLIKVLWLILLIPNGVCIMYFYRFCLSATSLIFTRAENLQFIWYSLYRISLRPDFMFTPWFRTIITTVFPLAMISSVPARIMMEPINPTLLIGTLAMGPLLIWLSNCYWRFCLSKYSSASS
jgi:ABC-2 type transport system permease protein